MAVVKEQWESKVKLPQSVIDFVQTTNNASERYGRAGK